MKAHLNHPVFSIVRDICAKEHVLAYVIGGFVRDLLINRPSKDIDIVIVGDGIDIARKTAKAIGDEVHVSVFKTFGTAMIKDNDFEIEFVGARKESYVLHSRSPEVAVGTLEDDQNRRDFTINALAISLNVKDYGLLIDPFHGLEDVEAGIIKTPLEPGITFSDDPLRMMRAVRFAAQLNFKIDSDSLAALTVHRDRILIVSMERISDELNKIILSPKPSIGFKLLFETGILKIIFPQMVALHGVQYMNGKGHKDNFFHTLEVLDNIAAMTANLWLRWAAVLHDIAKPDTKRFDEQDGWTFHGHEDKGSRMVEPIFRHLKLPLNEKMKYVQKLVLLHLRPIVLAKSEVTDSAVRRLLFEAGDDIDDLMMLCQADITTKNDYKKTKYRQNFELVKRKLVEVETKDKIRNWQPPITGEHIMQHFNLKPCRQVGILKNAIRDAILDGIIPNKYEDAFHYLLIKAKEIGLEPIKPVL